MKRIGAFLLLSIMLLTAGCSGEAEEIPAEKADHVLYFMERELTSAAGGGALRAEPVQLNNEEIEDTTQVIEWLVETLLRGPTDETLISPFPVGTTLRGVSVEGTRAVIDLSYQYSTLSGVELTLADQALVLTLTQLPNILSVKITVQGDELDYRDRQVFTARDVVLMPEGDVVGTIDAELYFLDRQGVLTPEHRVLELYEGDTQVGAVVRAIEGGPKNDALSAVLPNGFQTKSVWLEEETCYVNLSTGILENLSSDIKLEITLSALVQSILSLEAVSEVCFLVDGEFSDYYGNTYVGHAYAE